LIIKERLIGVLDIEHSSPDYFRADQVHAITILAALVGLLRLHGLGADPEQIRQSFGAKPIGVTEMLRCAKSWG
jgi:subfamily B ATP-binding cassette protein HlyB/CyaB